MPTLKLAVLAGLLLAAPVRALDLTASLVGDKLTVDVGRFFLSPEPSEKTVKFVVPHVDAPLEPDVVEVTATYSAPYLHVVTHFRGYWEGVIFTVRYPGGLRFVGGGAYESAQLTWGYGAKITYIQPR